MKKSLTLSLFVLIAIISSNAQNVGIGTINPLERLSVGNTSQFRIDINGNITRINNLPYSFPSVQGTNQYLKNDGAGNLSWTPAPRPVVRIFSIVNNGMSDWAIDGPADYNSGSNLDPGLVLQRGFTYQFDINATGHPFRISTAVGGAPYNVGVTNNSEDQGTIIFTVPMDAPSSLVYYCTAHSGTMNGTITIQ